MSHIFQIDTQHVSYFLHYFFSRTKPIDEETLSGDSLLRTLTGDKTNTKRAIIEQINSCLERPHLLNVYDSESGVEMTKAIFNALRQGRFVMVISERIGQKITLTSREEDR